MEYKLVWERLLTYYMSKTRTDKYLSEVQDSCRGAGEEKVGNFNKTYGQGKVNITQS